ncbi:MAG: PRC-barrel domain-containing protein [Candidatus ainarchaeum sp.]|nr:PRC-barrel domain-containing protein [Candidatus ainarchaeum sp.]
MLRLSELFGRDIYTDIGDYKGKVYDIVVNLETGKLETITTEPLKVKTKQQAKKIITEKSIPYKNVLAVKDIIIVASKNRKIDDSGSDDDKKRPSIKAGALVSYR